MPLSRSSSPSSTSEAVLRLEGVATRVAGHVLRDHIDLAVYPGEVLAVVGASGSGKSVLLRTILGLLRPAAGRIEAFGRDLTRLHGAALRQVERRWGVLFQDGALFSSLTVAENIGVPLKETLGIDQPLRD